MNPYLWSIYQPASMSRGARWHDVRAYRSTCALRARMRRVAASWRAGDRNPYSTIGG